MLEKKLLTKEEVLELNSGKVPYMPYMKDRVEWEDGYDYYLVYGKLGNWINKIKKEDQ